MYGTRRRRRRRQQMIRRFCFLAVLSVVAAAGLGILNDRTTKEKQKLLTEGIASMDTGDYETAIGCFEQALQMSGKRIGTLEKSLLLYQAEAEYMLQDYQTALHTYHRLMKEDRENLDYKKGAVLCMVEIGDFETALNLGIMEGWIYNRMAAAQIDCGEYDEALRSIEKGMASGDESVMKGLAYHQAVVWEFKGDYQKALELFETYAAQYGMDEEVEREITFLKSRQSQ